MAFHRVCLFLLLISRPCWTSMVRRVGCMVPLGSEADLVKENLGGAKGLGILTSTRQPGNGRPSQPLLPLPKKTGPFHTATENSDSMTIQSCVLRCWKMRFTFAALQDSTRCLCANTQEGLVPVDRWLCHQRCSGNCKQLCGGRVALSVYYTGYEEEPTLRSANLSRGLLGCYQQTTWKDWCESTSPSSVVVTFDKQQARQLGDLFSQKGQMLVNVRKPPLVSARMSALMCASYCVSQPQAHPVAVLQAQDTCCCGQSLGSSSFVKYGSHKVDFAQHCTDPCADFASSPLCVGSAGDKRYISVYNTFAIWSVESSRPELWNPDASWLQPQFPAHDDFEVSSFKPKWTPPEQDELSGVNDQPPSPSAPIEDSANMAPWVFVLDDPLEDGGDAAIVWILSAIVVFCCLLFLAILVILHKRKKKLPEYEISRTPWRDESQDQENAEMIEITTETSEMEKIQLRKDFTGNNNNYCSETDKSANHTIENEEDGSDSESIRNENETDNWP